MAYTFVFYVMVTTILMNMIFGIIIDTFAELREKKEQIEEQITGMLTYAHVCSRMLTYAHIR
jgi:inositol 1,4,5-triphosphate receptor type 1